VTRAPADLRRRSIRVALVTTAVVALAYLLVSVAVVAYVTRSLTDQIDGRLRDTLVHVAEFPAPFGQPLVVPRINDPLGPGRAIWTIGPAGVPAVGDQALELPAPFQTVTEPTTALIDGTEVRVAGLPVGEMRVIVAESLEQVNDARRTVILGVLLVAPALLLTVFVGSVIVGRRVAGPIDAARQRQLDFTADASHELRTPLAVIEANASLALGRERDPAWDRRAFERMDAESRRMRNLLDDLLWLARLDATRGLPGAEPVDLGLLAQRAADRFRPVAERKRITLRVEAASGGTVTAPTDWLDRLLGILLDNACKYSPEGGVVTVGVAVGDGSVELSVEDTGPGIPEEERDRIFGRFHRATDGGDGAGLGLSIAEVIVRGTGGRWNVGEASAGGARMTVSWLAAPAG
jgi:signal transduction histidine kinase